MTHYFQVGSSRVVWWVGTIRRGLSLPIISVLLPWSVAHSLSGSPILLVACIVLYLLLATLDALSTPFVPKALSRLASSDDDPDSLSFASMGNGRLSIAHRVNALLAMLSVTVMLTAFWFGHSESTVRGLGYAVGAVVLRVVGLAAMAARWRWVETASGGLLGMPLPAHGRKATFAVACTLLGICEVCGVVFLFMLLLVPSPGPQLVPLFVLWALVSPCLQMALAVANVRGGNKQERSWRALSYQGPFQNYSEETGGKVKELDVMGVHEYQGFKEETDGAKKFGDDSVDSHESAQVHSSLDVKDVKTWQ